MTHSRRFYGSVNTQSSSKCKHAKQTYVWWGGPCVCQYIHANAQSQMVLGTCTEICLFILSITCLPCIPGSGRINIHTHRNKRTNPHALMFGVAVYDVVDKNVHSFFVGVSKCFIERLWCASQVPGSHKQDQRRRFLSSNDPCNPTKLAKNDACTPEDSSAHRFCIYILLSVFSSVLL